MSWECLSLKKKIIYHMPTEFPVELNSASKLRPKVMLDTFLGLGYEVELVSGYSKKRAEDIARVLDRISKGDKFDFLYSENTTMPIFLTDPDHLPRNPFLELKFFRSLKKNGVKIGVFYRDIYWRFPNYGKNLSWLKRYFAKTFYYLELLMFRYFIDTLFLPTERMAKYVPIIKKSQFKELPPGARDLNLNRVPKETKKPINLLYIGGISHTYRLGLLVKSMGSLTGKAKLTICCHQEQWEEEKGIFGELPQNVQVVHLSGDDLKQLYENADIGVLFVEPHLYWSFAAPVKLFEYVSNGLPVLACNNTFTSDFVNEHRVGWSIEYDMEKFTTLIKSLYDNPASIDDAVNMLNSCVRNNLWETRVKTIEDRLSV